MNNNKLSVKEKIGYGMGDAGCNIIHINNVILLRKFPFTCQ